MRLTRRVNDVDVPLTPEEQTALEAEWAAWSPPPPPTGDERIDMMGPVMVAFLKVYARDRGLTERQVRDAIIAEL